jgi:ubiquinone/menaquinone biosynthesis C-methylase UbiE
MESSAQKNAFLSYEADAWFERNMAYLDKYSVADDNVVSLLKKYRLQPQHVLEIGCSAGYRLDGISKQFKGTLVSGIEPSTKAIEAGRKKFPAVTFVQGTADNLQEFMTGSMDVVIVGFVFYVIDRNIIFKVIAEIDRVLTNGGILVIVDFFAESALKNAYLHIKDFSAYSFKQNYEEIFTASMMYYLLDKCTLNHNNRQPDATEDYFNKYSITMLKKDTLASYK